jgi:hypothetical protein
VPDREYFEQKLRDETELRQRRNAGRSLPDQGPGPSTTVSPSTCYRGNITLPLTIRQRRKIVPLRFVTTGFTTDALVLEISRKKKGLW